MHWDKNDIKNADRIERLNLLNSITGIKPANLIGSISKSGQENLAIFSSIVHLSSDPALIGFILRPTGEISRNTYENILETGFYTINQVNSDIVKRAHYTSAKFPKEISEFDRCNIPAEYVGDFKVPFVRNASVQLGVRFVEEVVIPMNGTKLVIGEIEELIVKDDCMEVGGHINLEKSKGVGVSGLNSYYSLQKIDQFPFARVQETPDFN